MKINPTSDFIKKNYDKTLELINKHVPDSPNIDRRKNLKKLVEYFGERYALSSASSRTNHHAAFPGGLCFHNLHVFHWVQKFAELMAKDRYSNDTLLTVSLLHDLGKIGDMTHEYYVKNESKWHRERGMLYEINEKIDYMKVPDRSLYLASKFNIDLSQEEYLAVRLHDGMYEEMNRHYAMKEPTLARVLHFADLHATMLEKEFDINYS